MLALLTGREAIEILDSQRAAHLDSMRMLTRRKAGGDLAEQLISDHVPFQAGPEGLDLICIGGRKPKGGDTERVPDFWD